MKEKILILSSNYGEGHKQAAKAIYEETQKEDLNQMECLDVDFMALIHPVMNPVYRSLFLKSVSKVPSVYGYIYYKTSMSKLFNEFSKLLLVHSLRVMKLIKEYQPDVIVSTFPLASACISTLKSIGMTQAALITVITDHSNHRLWVHDHTNHYIVGSDYVKKFLLQQSVPSSNISVTGIPIHSEYHNKSSMNRLKEKYGLDADKPVVLLMGGAYGVFGKQLSSVLNRIKTTEFQFIVICGHNQKLFDELSNQVQLLKNIKVIGFTHDVYEFMSIADLLITKPGGLTISEAIANECPLLLFNAIPGQEEENAKYLIENGVAAMVPSKNDLLDSVLSLMSNPEKLQDMKRKMVSIQKKHAASEALSVIINVSRIQTNSIPYTNHNQLKESFK
jgi:processive 1,2-diacylglycerol beta-glucosyltransferase